MQPESEPQAPTPTKSKEKLKRKRARAACITCNQRKVRCDGAIVGAPCTNCRLDTLNCCMRARLRERRRMKQNVPSHHVTKVFSFVPQFMNVRTDIRDAVEIPSWSAPVCSLLEDVNDGTLFPNDSLMIHSRAVTQARLHSDASQDFRPSKVAQISAAHDVFPSSHGLLDLVTLKDPQIDRIDYLKSKGCFQLPNRPHLDELVRHYFYSVHPHLPVLEEEEFGLLFTSTERENDLLSRYSILVLQSMLFAASAFISLSAVKAMGFQTYHVARKTFYERAKLLYDFQVAMDSTAISQAALLLSFHSSPTIPHNNSSWLSIGIQHARAENCHLYYCTPDLSARQRSQKKRLWWCCVIRDRVIALGMRRHVQITMDHFDFDQETVVEDDFALEIEHSEVYSAEKKRLLVREFVVQCQLAVAVTSSLLVMYPLNGQMFPIVSKKSDFLKRQSQVEECTKELAKWEDKAKLQSPLDEDNRLRTCEAVVVYQDLTYLYYSSARIALCNHTIRMLTEYYDFATDSMERIHATRIELEKGIFSVCRIITSLMMSGFVGHLPISVIAWVALPLALLLLDSKLSPNTSQHISSQHGYHFYSEFLRLFGLRFEFVDTVTSIINTTVDLVESALLPTGSPRVNGSLDMASMPSKPAASPPSGWSDVLARHPRLYFRILSLLDSSLSRDQQPFSSFPFVDTASEIDPSSSLALVTTKFTNPPPKLQPAPHETARTWLDELLGGMSSERLQKTSLSSPDLQEHTLNDLRPFLPHDIFGFSGDGFELFIEEGKVDCEEKVVVEEDAHQMLEDMISFMFHPSPASCGF